MRRVTSSQMRAIDSQAINAYGISGIVLMENAGIKAVGHIRQMTEKLDAVAVFCGKGNNGGDGFVIARHLHIDGCRVKIFFVGDIGTVTGDALINLNIAQKLKIPITPLEKPKDLKKARDISRCDLIVDAIFGTGFSGMCPALHTSVISAINDAGVPVLAVDNPSGLDATSGKIGNICVKADRTVTFGLPKKGQMLGLGPDYVGKLCVENISFPKSLLE